MTPVFILDDVKDVLYDYCYGQSAGNNELKHLTDDEEIIDDSNISIEDIEEVHSDCDSCQVIPDPETEVHLITSSHHYTLLSFCETRWYSAWLVMSRFLSLFGALTALKENMLESRSGYDPKQKKEFVAAMDTIDKKELTKVVHFLRPLVQGIDFCQQDSSLQLDVVPMINSLLGYYQKHTLSVPVEETGEGDGCTINLPHENVEELFEKRFDLFKKVPTHLCELFYDQKLEEWNNTISESDPRIQQFCDQIGKEVESYLLPTANFFEREEQIKRIRDANRSRTEAISFLKDYKKRIGIHVGEYMKMYSTSYPILFPIFQDLFCQVASSAAVERSFSAHGRLLSPQRNSLKGSQVCMLMQIRQNVKCAQQLGEIEKLIRFIKNYDSLLKAGQLDNYYI